MSKAAMKLALEALEGIHPGNMTPMAEEYWNKAITALREALAEPQEKYQYGTPLLDAMRGKANEALDKKAENARELGLDYEPAPVAKPHEQEPVAVVSGYYGGQCVILPIDPARIFNSNTALYTSQPAQRTWVGLTDEQLDDVYFCVEGGSSAIETWREQARAIEARLKEKNT